MKTVKQVCDTAGVSRRTLRYYHKIGLLCPERVSRAGYRLYSRRDIKRLHRILLLRELNFPLKEIKKILDSPNFSRDKALDDQITLLEMERDRLEKIIAMAKQLKEKGEITMDFKAFDKKKIEEYSKRAKEKWGDTARYRESEEKEAARSEAEREKVYRGLMDIFVRFGSISGTDPAGEEAQGLAARLKDYITRHFYKCDFKILSGLGQMYCAPGEMKDNIDACAGRGTADFASKAIAIFCRDRI